MQKPFVKTRLGAIFRKLGTFSSKSSGHPGPHYLIKHQEFYQFSILAQSNGRRYILRISHCSNAKKTFFENYSSNFSINMYAITHSTWHIIRFCQQHLTHCSKFTSTYTFSENIFFEIKWELELGTNNRSEISLVTENE